MVTKTLPIPFIDDMFFMISTDDMSIFFEIHQKCIQLIDDKLLHTFVDSHYDALQIKKVLELIPHSFSQSRIKKELSQYKKHISPTTTVKSLVLLEKKLNENDFIKKIATEV